MFSLRCWHATGVGALALNWTFHTGTKLITLAISTCRLCRHVGCGRSCKILQLALVPQLVCLHRTLVGGNFEHKLAEWPGQHNRKDILVVFGVSSMFRPHWLTGPCVHCFLLIRCMEIISLVMFVLVGDTVMGLGRKVFYRFFLSLSLPLLNGKAQAGPAPSFLLAIKPQVVKVAFIVAQYRRPLAWYVIAGGTLL